MLATQVLQNLQSQGFSIQLQNDSLLVSPREKITDSIRDTIREHKPELIKILTKRPSRTNTLKVDQLTKRIESLKGVFYDDEDLVFAMRWLLSGNDSSELETLILAAEFQIFTNKKPQTI
jgi:hypothetical protein